MTRIGLIGATGGVGAAALRHLLSESTATIAAASRRPERSEGAKAWGDRLVPQRLDLFDDRDLAAFCRSVDIVVNCAGPSGQMLDRVAMAAIGAGKPVIDAGGYDPVVRRLRRQGGRIREAGVPAVINAGLLPGLSGLYPRWIASSRDTSPRALEVFYAGTDHWSFASAWDIIHSLGDFGAERPPSLIENGAIASRPVRKAFRRLDLPPPIGTVSGFLTYTEELATLASALGIAHVRCHGVDHGRWSGAALGMVKLCRLYRTPAQIERSARWLVRAAARDRRQGQVPCFAIDCRAGWVDGQTRHGRIVIADTYAATGIVVGIATTMLLQGRVRSSGPQMLHQVVEPSAFLEAFREHATILTETPPEPAAGSGALPEAIDG